MLKKNTYRKLLLINEDQSESLIDDYMYWYDIRNIMKWSKDPDIDYLFDEIVENENNIEIQDRLKKNKRFIKKHLDF